MKISLSSIREEKEHRIRKKSGGDVVLMTIVSRVGGRILYAMRSNEIETV